ncbi:MAG: vWA domain-containing protein [Candidatus Hodarchaeales archaeon]|jgi:Ca-activated chloride channel family protein
MKNKKLLIVASLVIGVLSFAIVPETTYASPGTTEYKSGFFTLEDVIIFSYDDGLEFSIYDSAGTWLITETLDKGEHYYYHPGEGVYSIIGNQPYSLLTGDPISNYICGYFAADDSYRGVANEFYTYTSSDQDVIVFAYSSGTTNVDVEYWDDISSSWVSLASFSLSGPGDHYREPRYSWSNKWLHFTSDQPISVQSYSDRCFFVPDESGLWSGTHFYMFAGWYGGGDNLHIHSYEDNNEIIVNYIGGSDIWSGTLDDGEMINIDYTTIGMNQFIEVTSTGIITVSDEPYWDYDYYGLLTVPDETGTGVGVKFYTYARERPTAGLGSIWVYAYNDGTNVEIKDMDTDTIEWSGTLNENEFHKFTPASGTGGDLFGIFSDQIVSVVEGTGGWGAEFVPLLYAAEPPPEILPPEVTKTVSPEDIIIGTGENSTVTIEVTGAGGTETTITPMDVVFAIDSSGSMGWNDPANLRLDAAKDFVGRMVDTRDQGGVVDWDTYVHTPPTFGLTTDFLTLNNSIDQVDSWGGTNLDAGLLGAITMLDANTRVDPSAEIIIFLTDGQGTYYHSRAVEAASKGYIIYSIGLGAGHDPVPLQDMAAETGGAYYDSPDPGNLEEIYDTIYEEIITSTVPHYVDVIEVTESYIVVDETSFNIEPDSITHNLDGTTTIIWENIGMYADDDPDLDADEIVTLTFDIKSRISGDDLEVDVYEEAIVEYSDKEGNFIGAVYIPQATINVHPFVTDLIAGGGNPKSAIDVGDVTIWNDEGFLYIVYETTNDWYITETHLHVADSLEGIPQTKKYNPIPGHFTYQIYHDPSVQTYMYVIPWTWDPGTTLYIAAHAVVQKIIGYDIYENPIYQIETAWGDGLDFEGNNWATYIIYRDP